MSKRNNSLNAINQPTGSHPQKRARITKEFHPIKVASQEASAAADAKTPFSQLETVLDRRLKSPQTGDCVVYWMRMSDLRTIDNKALNRASKQARQDDIPLIVLFVFSPEDYIAHDRSARKIDFTLRNLAVLRNSLSKLHIPLYSSIEASRKTVPSSILSFCETYGATRLFGNIEYEVDELRRDIELSRLAVSKGVQINLFHNKCVVEPGVIVTKQKKPYAVYSPYQRQWITTINADIPYYLEDCLPPMPNNDSIRSSDLFGPLFDSLVPSMIEGFELDGADRALMAKVWPEGEDVAAEILQRFLTTKVRSSQLGAVNPLSSGSEDGKDSRIARYAQDRDYIDRDTTSRLSAYLSSGVISVRACLRAAMLKSNMVKVEGSGVSGVGRWIQEIAWRDFYTGILASFPRVSMGRPYLEKFSTVVWEDYQAPESPARWKAGQTGVPIVDATMRCINEMGWVHNRARMITAMYLTKDLMIDWRAGEKYFMEKLIDGDLASNNGGWQWCASTGVDPCPYFRIFNPYTQSLKADPSGDFIRHWVPELRHLRGPDLYNPSANVANRLGYSLPIIPHNEARKRALRRFKNPGVE
ncbi:hypothetical protein BYT27DRAFT_7087205 [Phlegmacium glaucopus]|nr:hypothetical protein BYT27DRAFT_7087205 [Phlegmacium glaucopus]